MRTTASRAPRNSNLWCGSQALNVKKLPGRALAAQVQSLWLWRCLKSRWRITETARRQGRCPLDKFEERAEQRVGASVEAVADKIEHRGGDAEL